MLGKDRLTIEVHTIAQCGDGVFIHRHPHTHLYVYSQTNIHTQKHDENRTLPIHFTLIVSIKRTSEQAKDLASA